MIRLGGVFLVVVMFTGGGVFLVKLFRAVRAFEFVALAGNSEQGNSRQQQEK